MNTDFGTGKWGAAITNTKTCRSDFRMGQREEAGRILSMIGKA